VEQLEAKVLSTGLEKKEQKTDEYKQLRELRKGQAKMENNFLKLQQKLEQSMKKYKKAMVKITELKAVQSKLIDRLSREREDTESETDSVFSLGGLSEESDTENTKVTKKQNNNGTDERLADQLQTEADKDVREYRNNLTHLIQDMKDHGQEISGLRKAFQQLKTKMTSGSSTSAAKPATVSSDDTTKGLTSTRTSMYNNYIESSDDDRDISDYEDEIDEEEEKRDKHFQQLQQQSSSTNSRIKPHIKPPVPVQEKRVSKKRKAPATVIKVTSQSKKPTATSVTTTKKKKTL
jgi:chromosome segregation ATPase